MSRVAFLTHYKAGSQWVTDVLSHPRILACVPWINFRRAPGLRYRMSDWASEGDSFFGGPIYSVAFSEWERFRRDGDKAIWVVRDPRDSMVSWAFSRAYSHVTEPGIEIIRPALLSLDLRNQLLIAMHVFFEMSSVFRSWAGRPRTESEFVTTYERLIGDEHGQFREMFEFLDWKIPEDASEEAITSLTFRSRSGGRSRGELDTFSHYRRGVAGDWRNYFDRALGKLFEQANPRLLIDLEYESTETWWETLPETNDALVLDKPAIAANFSERLTNALAERDKRLQWVHDEAETRLERMRQLRETIATLQSVCDERQGVIDELAATVQNLRTMAAERQALIEEQSKKLAELSLRCERLRGVADERLGVINALDGTLERSG